MAKPRTLTGNGVHFPYEFKGAGNRTGRIKKWSGGKFGIYFRHGGKKKTNSFTSFEAAYEYLERVFEQLDKGINPQMVMASSTSEDLRAYHELTQILRDAVPGATLRDAVDYFVTNRGANQFKPKPLGECIKAYLDHEKARNVTPLHLETLTRHTGHFERAIGSRKIHEIGTAEISAWLVGNDWSPKTRRNTRGTLVGLFLFSQKILHAIPHGQDVAPQLVSNPRPDAAAPVEVYTPEQMKKLLVAARDDFPALLPVIVLQAFQGLRPDEVHAENAERAPLGWDVFNWNDSELHIVAQKVRTKATRNIPLHAVTKAWLEPLAAKGGAIWTHAKSYTKKMKDLCERAEVPRLHNALRHSYASYRIRKLKGDLAKLAEEMGNSPSEIVRSYRRNITDKQADEWFSLTPDRLPAPPKA